MNFNSALRELAAGAVAAPSYVGLDAVVVTLRTRGWYIPDPLPDPEAATVWANWLLLPELSPVRRMSSAAAAIVRVDVTASTWIAPITISSPAGNDVVVEPMTVLVVPIETLPVSTAKAESPRKTWTLASP